MWSTVKVPFETYWFCLRESIIDAVFFFFVQIFLSTFIKGCSSYLRGPFLSCCHLIVQPMCLITLKLSEIFGRNIQLFTKLISCTVFGLYMQLIVLHRIFKFSLSSLLNYPGNQNVIKCTSSKRKCMKYYLWVFRKYAKYHLAILQEHVQQLGHY